MTIPYIQQAKEWANGALNDDPFPPYEGVAARVIQSLPDHIIDAEKVRELADQLVEEAGDFASEGLVDRYMTIAKRLRDILPTIPRPEEAKPGDYWLVRIGGRLSPVAAERDHRFEDYPWTVLEGRGGDHYPDAYVTLVSRLVPEVSS